MIGEIGEFFGENGYDPEDAAIAMICLVSAILKTRGDHDLEMIIDAVAASLYARQQSAKEGTVY